MASDPVLYDTGRLERRLDSLDTAIAGWMDRWGLRLLQYAIGVVFVWFGALKPLGLSPRLISSPTPFTRCPWSCSSPFSASGRR